MIVGEAPWLYLAIRTVIAGALVVVGGLDLTMGRFGMVMVGIAQLMQFESARRGYSGAKLLGHPPVDVPVQQKITSLPFRLPAGVERIDDLEYAPGLTLDLYRGPNVTGPSPTLIYVHGGSWGGGDPRRQFRTITHHLAGNGWVVLNIRYPRSPEATFPEHLLAVEQAVRWARSNGPEYGVDPLRVAIAGGSSGAHLAALTALGSNDTTVEAAVVLYGIYDFLNRNKTRFDWPLIPRNVMKTTPDLAPDLYRAASPIDQVHADAPPFLVVHGTHDSLVPIGESRFFADALRNVGGRVEMIEVAGAQHAFDALGGVRTRTLAALIESFLNRAVSKRHLSPGEGIMES